MIKIPQLLSQLMEAFQKANPKVIVRTPFTPHQNHLLKVLIKKYKETQSDLWLGKLAKLYLKFLSDGDDKAYMKARKLVAKTPSITPLVRNNILDKESKLVFKTPSVPGPARLCRVPFYPVRDENAWSSRFLEIDSASPSRQAFGIDELGDDPILAVGPWLSTSDTTSVGPYNMMTRKIEFGAYRLIGLEIAASYGNRYIGAVTAGTQSTGEVDFDGPAAVAASTFFRIIGPGPTDAGIDIRVTSTSGSDATFTSVLAAPGANEFLIGATINDTANNLAAKLNTVGGITATVVGAEITVTQSEVGSIGNGEIATSSDAGANGISAGDEFAGGSDNVSPDSTITLIDSLGEETIFTAVRAGGTEDFFVISQVDPVQTAENFRDAVNNSRLEITATNDGEVVTLTQNFTGTSGDTVIGTSFPAGGVTGYSVTDFAGGTDATTNLVSDLSPVNLSLRELTVYNGDNILIVEDSEAVSAGSFNILNRPDTFQYSYSYGAEYLTPTGQPASPLSKFKRDASYKFIGLRDQPIVNPNTQVFVKIEGFLASLPEYDGAYPANTPAAKIPPISLSINLVVDLLEDKIFGDPIVPSPASRPAANIKLGKIDVGNNRIIVTNAQTKKPTI